MTQRLEGMASADRLYTPGFGRIGEGARQEGGVQDLARAGRSQSGARYEIVSAIGLGLVALGLAGTIWGIPKAVRNEKYSISAVVAVGALSAILTGSGLGLLASGLLGFSLWGAIALGVVATGVAGYVVFKRTWSLLDKSVPRISVDDALRHA